MQFSYDDLLKSTLALLTATGIGGAGFWGALRLWARRPLRSNVATGQAALLEQQTAFQLAIGNQAEIFIASLQKLIAEQNRTIVGLERRVDELEDEARRCHGENRQLRSMVETLVRRLREGGIELPEDLPVTSIIEAEHDGVTALAGLRGGGRG